MADAPPVSPSGAFTPRSVLVVALVAGILALLSSAAVLVEWSSNLVDRTVSPTGASYASDFIVGRFGLVLAVAVAVSATTIAIVAVIATQRTPRASMRIALVIAAIQAIAVLLIVVGNWRDGWWYILERGWPKLLLVFVGSQVLALVWAGLLQPRRGEAGAE